MSIDPYKLDWNDRRVARVQQFVTQDLRKRRSRDEAAQVANLEPAYFSKYFLKIVGVSFSTWAAQTRIEAAKQALMTTNIRINEVAAAVGYESVTTFERAFFRYAGTCPREYRRGCGNKEDTKR
jgi:two-component system response regulator YesN